MSTIVDLAETEPVDPTVVGAVVQLKSGGPRMTVAGNDSLAGVACCWFDNNNRLQEAYLEPGTFKLAEEPTPATAIHDRIAETEAEQDQATRDASKSTESDIAYLSLAGFHALELAQLRYLRVVTHEVGEGCGNYLKLADGGTALEAHVTVERKQSVKTEAAAEQVTEPLFWSIKEQEVQDIPGLTLRFCFDAGGRPKLVIHGQRLAYHGESELFFTHLGDFSGGGCHVKDKASPAKAG